MTMLLQPMLVEPVTLMGRHVRLEPLSLRHHDALCQVGLDEELWRWIPAPVRTPDEMRAYIETALRGPAPAPPCRLRPSTNRRAAPSARPATGTSTAPTAASRSAGPG